MVGEDVGTVVLAALKRRGVATIPRASSPQHLAANAPRAVAAVTLDDEEVHTIDAAMKAMDCDGEERVSLVEFRKWWEFKGGMEYGADPAMWSAGALCFFFPRCVYFCRARAPSSCSC